LAATIGGGGTGGLSDSGSTKVTGTTRPPAKGLNVSDLGNDREDPELGIIRDQEGEAASDDDEESEFLDEIQNIATHVDEQYGTWKKLWEKLPSDVKAAQKYELERHAKTIDLLNQAKMNRRDPIYATNVVHFLAVQGVAAGRSASWVKHLYGRLGRNEQTTDLIRLAPKLAKHVRAQTILEDKLERLNKTGSGSSSGGGAGGGAGGGGSWYGGKKRPNRRPKKKKGTSSSSTSSSNSDDDKKRGGEAKSSSSVALKK
jgi:hypothetical protein